MELGESHCRAGCLYLGKRNSYIWLKMESQTTVGITRRHTWICAVSWSATCEMFYQMWMWCLCFVLITLPQRYENKPDNNVIKETVFITTETRFADITILTVTGNGDDWRNAFAGIHEGIYDLRSNESQSVYVSNNTHTSYRLQN